MGSAARGRRGTPGNAGGAGSPGMNGMNGGRGMAGVVHGGMVREQEEGRRQRWAEVRQRFRFMFRFSVQSSSKYELKI